MDWEEREIQRSEGGEEQANINGQLPTQVQGDAWAWVLTKDQLLIQDPEQLRGLMLMYVAPVITEGCAGACGRSTFVFKGYAASGDTQIWVACMATRDHGDNLGCCQGPCLGLWSCCSQGLC